MRTKQLFKTSLLSLTVLCSMALAIVSCANEDIAQNNIGGDNDKNFTTFVAGEPTKTRTSMDYSTGKFYWEEGDKIYVLDDEHHVQESNAVDAAHAHSTSFKFKVPGKFNNSATYKVYYLGKNSSNNEVAIPAAQTQTTPNSTKHLGEFGDYGTATATGTLGGGLFSFQLEHQVTYLVFQPYTSNNILKKCYLTKIEVNSDDDIAETYTIDPNTGNLTSSAGSKQIILATRDPVTGSTNEKGFSFTNAASSSTADKVYMPIKSGVHTLKVRYWVKDYDTNVEGTITKVLPSFNYDKNTYYDMTADLNVTNYEGDKYYMWDAQQNYWADHEWNSVNPWQPTLTTQSANPNYPKSNSDNRWYNETFSSGVDNPATHSSFSDVPNINEITWYVMKGDPRYDSDELWTTMGHLYKGGIWLLKKAHIQGYRDDKAYDNSTDFRITGGSCNNFSSLNLPSAVDINKYFFLPFLGYYTNGKLVNIGEVGKYWSSSGSPYQSGQALSLHIANGLLSAGSTLIATRYYGYRIQKFE